MGYDWKSAAIETMAEYIYTLPDRLQEVRIEYTWKQGEIGVISSNIIFDAFILREERKDLTERKVISI